jgi:hypothetical protein
MVLMFHAFPNLHHCTDCKKNRKVSTRSGASTPDNSCMSILRSALGISALAMALAGSRIGPAAGEPEQQPTPDKSRDLIAAHLADLEGAAAMGSGGGLKAKAFVVPDAVAYRVAKEYLSHRAAGEGHDDAVRAVSNLLPAWKRREGQAALVLSIENAFPRSSKVGEVAAPRKVFTLQKDFAQEAVVLTSPAGKSVPARLAQAPVNLRQAQLQIKKFWTTEDGATRRGTYDPNEPASIGRKAVLSKPFPALLIESKAIEAELLFKARAAKDIPQRFAIQGFKCYEGPFEKDQLDLNGGRQWDDVAPFTVDLRPPPGGLQTPAALVLLIKEVREASLKAGPSGVSKKSEGGGRKSEVGKPD